MNLSNLTVKTKLWAGFGVMALIVAAVSGAAPDPPHASSIGNIATPARCFIVVPRDR